MDFSRGGIPLEGWIECLLNSCEDCTLMSSKIEREGRECLWVKRKIREFSDTTRFELRLKSPVIIPNGMEGNVEVTLTYSTECLVNGLFYVHSADPEKNTVFCDSAQMYLGPGFARTSVNVSGGRVLVIGISGFGIDRRDYPAELCPSIYLDSLDICIGGRSLRNVQAKRTADVNADMLNGAVPVTLSTDGLTVGFACANSHVLGVGFNNKCGGVVSDAVIGVIKNQISEGGCRAVVAEIPLFDGLILNRYVSGDPRFNLTCFSDIGTDSLFLDLIRWIKEFNSDRNDKVRIFGINFLTGHIRWNAGQSIGWEEYLQTLNKPRRYADIDSLIRLSDVEIMFVDPDVAYSYAANYMETNMARFDKIMGDDARILHYYLRNCMKGQEMVYYDFDWNPHTKDSLQYDMFLSVVEPLLTDSNGIVFSGGLSTLHHSEVSRLWNRSLGCRLRDRYGSRYSCIGIISDMPMQGRSGYTAPSFSMDALCQMSSFPMVYVDCTRIGGLVCVRNDSYFLTAGRYISGAEELYDVICPEHFMDGMIIVK